MLSKKPEEITLEEILAVTEGPFQFSDCLVEGGSCEKSDQCSSKKVWAYVNDKINDVLRQITLEEIVAQEKK